MPNSNLAIGQAHFNLLQFPVTWLLSSTKLTKWPHWYLLTQPLRSSLSLISPRTSSNNPHWASLVLPAGINIPGKSSPPLLFTQSDHWSVTTEPGKFELRCNKQNICCQNSLRIKLNLSLGLEWPLTTWPVIDDLGKFEPGRDKQTFSR